MGVPPLTAMGAIRFSLGRTTTLAEITHVVQRLCETVR
jgi:cysteine sulfinate desulfinase/cysteine desulfurase-like protein